MSARKYVAWWSNDRSHSQAKSWISSGYRTDEVSLKTCTVRFFCDGIRNNVNPVKKTTTITREKLFDTSLANIDSNITLSGYTFKQTTFAVHEQDIAQVFLNYTGHTVGELLRKRHYAKLAEEIHQKYSYWLERDIKEFMQYLINSCDDFYLKFLNKNGADNFCRFVLTDQNIFQKRGLYAYVHNDKLMYIGRCRDNFRARFNLNYGTIQPINCFKEGQSTNTHINSLMNKMHKHIKIYLCILSDESEIIHTEETLIKKYKPEWNRTY